MGYIRLEKDSDGIVDLIFDQPNKSVNVMNDEYNVAMRDAVVQLIADKNNISGVYIRSGKPGQFFAGGDITAMMALDLNPSAEEKAKLLAGVLSAKAPLRQLETLGVPVAVGINGAALGGGYEIALACHYRVALDHQSVQVGLPEAQLGLMPGAGGVVRLTRMLGMQEALTLISQGKRLKSKQALKKGLVDELAAGEAEMASKAKAWIKANPDAQQPWDKNGYQMPGGGPTDLANQGLMYFGPVNMMNKTRGNMPAQQIIFAAIADTARVDFDTAEKIEARYFLRLLLDQTARNMMTTFFVQMSALDGGASRPGGIAKTSVQKLGILGAGVMGAGIAFAAAQVGIDVVLKDVSQENANKGKAYSVKACEKNRRIDTGQTEQILARIQPTADVGDLAGCDLIIEAVFEDRGVKASVTKETEMVLAADTVFATNTSAMPISELAEASARPENFIGMHFFSPAERMPLVEIITGAKTSPQTLAKAFDLAVQLGKKPIVVQDSPGFFTTRVIGKTITEGQMMLAEGVNPVLIENAARFNGSPMGPLETLDSISLETAYHAMTQAQKDAAAKGETWLAGPQSEVLRIMVEDCDRRGQAHGGGFYQYAEDGSKYLWPGLKEKFAPSGYTEVSYEDLKDRLLFSQVVEALRILDEGIIGNIGDGNIGSIMGIGFPPHTGGVYQYVNAYGLHAFAKRAHELADAYGERFTPPAMLLQKAEKDELFL